jgi:hypothetical protein
VLAAVWLLLAVSGLFGGAGAIFWAAKNQQSWVPWLLLAIFFVTMGLTLGLGLWGRAPWARLLQIGISGFGLLTCILTPLSAVSLYYMLRPSTVIHFSGRRTFRELTEDEAALVRAAPGEPLFAGGVLAAIFAGAILAAIATFIFFKATGGPA